MRRSIRMVIVLAMLGLLAPGQAGAAETHTLYMSHAQFCAAPVCRPEARTFELTISRGDSVEWVFADPSCYPLDVAFGLIFEGAPFVCYHDVVASDGSFASAKMPVDPDTLAVTGTSFVRTFARAGTYAYVCTLHAQTAGMRGRIVVRP